MHMLIKALEILIVLIIIGVICLIILSNLALFINQKIKDMIASKKRQNYRKLNEKNNDKNDENCENDKQLDSLFINLMNGQICDEQLIFINKDNPKIIKLPYQLLKLNRDYNSNQLFKFDTLEYFIITFNINTSSNYFQLSSIYKDDNLSRFVESVFNENNNLSNFELNSLKWSRQPFILTLHDDRLYVSQSKS